MNSPDYHLNLTLEESASIIFGSLLGFTTFCNLQLGVNYHKLTKHKQTWI